MRNPIKMVMMVFGGLAAAVALVFLVGIIVQELWNALMPDIFGLPEVSYWQALGLLILGHMLLGRNYRHDKRSRSRKPLPCGEKVVEIENSIGV